MCEVAQVCLTSLCCTVLAYIIAALSPNMDVANGALPGFVVIQLFFVGLLIRPQDQPAYWHWSAYPCPCQVTCFYINVVLQRSYAVNGSSGAVSVSLTTLVRCECFAVVCRYQYIDFLHYPWVAQMVNQFEHTQIYIFLNLEVLPCLDPKFAASDPVRHNCLKWSSLWELNVSDTLTLCDSLFPDPGILWLARQEQVGICGLRGHLCCGVLPLGMVGPFLCQTPEAVTEGPL